MSCGAPGWLYSFTCLCLCVGWENIKKKHRAERKIYKKKYDITQFLGKSVLEMLALGKLRLRICSSEVVAWQMRFPANAVSFAERVGATSMIALLRRARNDGKHFKWKNIFLSLASPLKSFHLYSIFICLSIEWWLWMVNVWKHKLQKEDFVGAVGAAASSENLNYLGLIFLIIIKTKKWYSKADVVASAAEYALHVHQM